MAFSKALCSAVLLYIVTFAHGEVTISDFSGVWRSYTDVAHVNIFTPGGLAVVCRNTLSPGCEDEITQIEETFTLNGTTFSLGIRDRVGITTVEQAAAAHPECAKDGLYPVERIIVTPFSQILSYDFKNDRIYFIDPRRPDELNCLPAKYRIGEDGRPYIEITLVEFFTGTVPDVLAFGISFQCDPFPQPCSVSANDQGIIDLKLQATFNVTCIDGDCLNAVGATSPSASRAPNESAGDL